MAQLVITLITLAAGALLGVIPTYLLERSKQRATLLTRWDEALYHLCAEFAGTARQLMHVAGRLKEDLDRDSCLAQIDDLHRHLRALREQIRLIGSAEVQSYARLVQRHAYWMRVTAEGGTDAGASAYGGMPADRRVAAELYRFYAAARRQLRVPNPNELAPDDPHPIPFESDATQVGQARSSIMRRR
jgi:hypothetical protein